MYRLLIALAIAASSGVASAEDKTIQSCADAWEVGAWEVGAWEVGSTCKDADGVIWKYDGQTWSNPDGQTWSTEGQTW